LGIGHAVLNCSKCGRPTSAARPTCIYCGTLTRDMGAVSPLESDLTQARTHMQFERYEQALFAFGRAIAADPRSVEAWLGRAAAFVHLSRPGVRHRAR
jgi:hypothetical protein